MRAIVAAIVIVCVAVPANPAHAWGNAGHKQTGWIADRILEDATREKIHGILGYDLGTAAIWADCLKSVVKVGSTFQYKPRKWGGTCAPFKGNAERARMEDYVRRNWNTCGSSVRL